MSEEKLGFEFEEAIKLVRNYSREPIVKKCLLVPTGLTWPRLAMAIKLWDPEKYEFLLISGGTAWPGEMDAFKAKRFLETSNIISQQYIVSETTSSNTLQQAKQCLLILRQQQIEEVDICVCYWHAARLNLIFQKQQENLGTEMKLNIIRIVYAPEIAYPKSDYHHRDIEEEEARKIVQYRKMGDL